MFNNIPNFRLNRLVMVDSQILEHSSTPVNYTMFDVNWVPSSPRLAVCGSTLAGEGTLRVYTLAEPKFKVTCILLVSYYY